MADVMTDEREKALDGFIDEIAKRAAEKVTIVISPERGGMVASTLRPLPATRPPQPEAQPAMPAWLYYTILAAKTVLGLLVAYFIIRALLPLIGVNI